MLAHSMGWNPNEWPLQSHNSGDTIKVWKLKRGSSAVAATGRFQPTNPTNLSITAVDRHPYLTWNRCKPRDSARYHVYRSTSENGTYTQLTSTALSDTSYSDTQIRTGGGTPRFYKVRAISGDGNK